jgi:CRP-like cAMP-binding protein
MDRGSRFDHVWFPTGSLMSMVVNLSSGETVEAMLIGIEGFVGAPALFGERMGNADVFVQIPGPALRMDLAAFDLCREDDDFRNLLGAFVTSSYERLAQSVACIQFHPVEQRLARWLLLVGDAIEAREFALTQEFIGIMLGVHRPTVTIAIRTLEQAGLIGHRRGRVYIRDREALAEASCECYAATGAGRARPP